MEVKRMSYIKDGKVWVHSNIYDFHATIPDTVSQTALADINNYITMLDAYIEPLKSRANEFIRAANCSDYLDLSGKLFGVGKDDLTFSGCAKRTLRDQRFIRALSHLKYDIRPVLEGASKEMRKLLIISLSKGSSS
jgi:hypothetical protein